MAAWPHGYSPTVPQCLASGSRQLLASHFTFDPAQGTRPRDDDDDDDDDDVPAWGPQGVLGPQIHWHSM